MPHTNGKEKLAQGMSGMGTCLAAPVAAADHLKLKLLHSAWDALRFVHKSCMVLSAAASAMLHGALLAAG